LLATGNTVGPAPQVERAMPLQATDGSVDLGPLFETVETRPRVLHVALDHPLYLPLEASVLVPEDLRRPETQGGQLATTLELVRAKALVTGTVALESGAQPARTVKSCP
jgi:hypothetical protein